MKKTLIITVAVILIAIAYYKLAPVWFAKNQQSNTADQTANWKTYTSAQYGFEFKYPKNLDATLSGSLPFNLSLSDGVNSWSQMVDVLELQKMSSKGLAGNIKYIESNPTNDSAAKGFKETPISGGTALYYLNSSSKDPGPSAYLISDKHIYLIDGSSLISEDTFQQIVSTFKFTN